MSIALTDETLTAIPRPLRASTQRIKSKPKPQKPLSKRKLLANRRNARKSTGPRTPAGKKIVSQNPLKHGLCAQTPLLPNECSATYTTYTQEIDESYNPTTIPQRILCDQPATPSGNSTASTTPSAISSRCNKGMTT